MPRIMIVVPSLGSRLTTLDRALASIRAQAGVLIDVVLVVPVVSPALAAVATAHQVPTIACSGGLSAAVNAGFAQGTGAHEYLGWLGDDDMLRPGALAAAGRLLDQHRGAVVAYGSCDYVDLDGHLILTRRPPPAAPALLLFVPGVIKQETCLFRRSALQQAGPLREDLSYAMDLDLLLRLRRVGPFVRTDRVQAAFCWHASSLTVANREASLDEAQRVQRQHARGLTRALVPLSQYPVRQVVRLLDGRMSRSLRRG